MATQNVNYSPGEGATLQTKVQRALFLWLLDEINDIRANINASSLSQISPATALARLKARLRTLQ